MGKDNIEDKIEHLVAITDYGVDKTAQKNKT